MEAAIVMHISLWNCESDHLSLAFIYLISNVSSLKIVQLGAERTHKFIANCSYTQKYKTTTNTTVLNEGPCHFILENVSV